MKKRHREINVFSVSFLDVLANTIGGLAFLLIFAVLMINMIIFSPPRIVTERLPDGYDGQEYTAWLAAREGLGKFLWSFGEGSRPRGLRLDPETGKLSGMLALPPSDARRGQYDFTVRCEARTDDSQGKPKTTTRRLRLLVHRERPIHTVPLRILTEPVLPGAYRDRPYPLAFAAEGGQPPYSWSGQAPPGLRLTADGRLTGAPTQTGKLTFDVSVSTPQGEHRSRTMSLEVAEIFPPPPPVPPLKALTRKLPAAVANRDYEIQVAAEGGSPPYTWTLQGGAPAWMRAGPGASTFAGKPALTDVGIGRVVLQVVDSAGRSASTRPIELETLPPVVKWPPLRLKTTALPDARAGAAYALALSAEGGVPPYRWTGGGPALQQGLQLTADGSLAGTPRRAGPSSIAVMVADSTGQSAAGELALRVRPPRLPVRILTRRAAVARAGQPYSLALSAVGGYPPYRWRLLDGELPPGLALDSRTGMITGTPRQAGDWEARVTAADAEGQGAAEPLPLRLDVLTARGVRPLRILTRTLPTLLAGRPAELALACEGGAPPYTWRPAGELPPGLAIDAGRLAGEPRTAGRYQVPVIVTDTSGASAAATLPLTVKWMVPLWLAILLGLLLLAALLLLRIYLRRRVHPLRITTEALPNARASFKYAVQLASEGGVPPYHWRLIEGTLPPGMELTPDGCLRGMPFEGINVDQTKDVKFTVELRDGAGQRDRKTL